MSLAVSTAMAISAIEIECLEIYPKSVRTVGARANTLKPLLKLLRQARAFVQQYQSDPRLTSQWQFYTPCQPRYDICFRDFNLIK